MEKVAPQKKQQLPVSLRKLSLLLLFCFSLLQAFSTKGTAILDDSGRVIFLHGINIGNERKSAPYQGWYTEKEYRAVGRQGLNVVRLLLSWAALEPKPGSWDKHYLEETKKRVRWIEEGGAKVVLDMHQDLFGVGFQGGNGAPRWACDENEYRAHKPRHPWWINYLSPPVQRCFHRFWKDEKLQNAFAQTWAVVAKVFKDDPQVIGFDLLNEPNQGDLPLRGFEENILTPFYKKIIQAIRRQTKEKLIFIEPSVAVQMGNIIHFGDLGDSRIVFAPHYYHPLVHDGAPYNGHTALMRSALYRYRKVAEKLKMPVWIGEYGGPAEGKGFVQYLQDLVSIFDAHRFSTSLWVLDKGGFGILNQDGSWRQPILNVLLRPTPRAVAGKDIVYKFSFQKKTFVLSYRPIPAKNKPTVVFLDAKRTYPEGFSLHIEGAEAFYNDSAKQLLLYRKPKAEKVKLKVFPKSQPSKKEGQG